MSINDTKHRATHIAAGVGIFSALAFLVSFVCEVIPAVSGFLSIDLKDAVICIASFIYGPIVAPLISLVVAAIELFTIGNDTGWYGFVMNFASSASFSTVASLIYCKKKSVNTALIAFASSIVFTTGVMVLLNAFVTPLYIKQIGIPFDVAANLSILFLPFNFAKTLLNSATAMLLYKPVITALRQAGLIPRSQYKTTFSRATVITLIVGGLFLALAIGLLVWLVMTFGWR
ncbi:MAG: ECF transporter S component [Clostridia bacterium]|nr:ECF transporter S component [Clostridia bacterium]